MAAGVFDDAVTVDGTSLSHHATPQPPASLPPRGRRLVSRTVPVRLLDRTTIDAAFALFDSLYAGADRNRFEDDLFDKQLVILLRDAADDTLRGFSTVHISEVIHGRRRARLVYSGDTAIHPAYWGQKRLQRAFSMILVREKIRHPTRPLLWFLISKGYKTYLLMVRHFPHSVPRVDRKADHRLTVTLHAVARGRFGNAYDPSTGVVSYHLAKERVRRNVAPIDRPLLTNPHVAFFAARNPGHERGDELACLARIRPIDPFRTMVGAWRNARLRRWRFK